MEGRRPRQLICRRSTCDPPLVVRSSGSESGFEMRQKGVAIRSTLQAIANLYGEASLARVKGALPEAVRAQIEPRVLPVAWYPIAVSAAIHEAIRDALGDGNWEISHTIGIEAARIDFTGVYRVFLRSMQYDTMWDRAQRAWTNYNSHGETRWVDR